MSALWFSLPVAVLVATAAPVAALELDLPGEAQRINASYLCDGARELDIEFINVGTNSLAIMDWDGQKVVMANVLSGSGARYAGGQYEFWDKGGNATLTDLRSDDTNGMACKQR